MKAESRKRQFIFDGKIKPSHCEGCGLVTEKVFVGEWMPSDKPKDDDLLVVLAAKKNTKKRKRLSRIRLQPKISTGFAVCTATKYICLKSGRYRLTGM